MGQSVTYSSKHRQAIFSVSQSWTVKIGIIFLVLFLLSDFFKAATLWIGVDLTAVFGLLSIGIAAWKVGYEKAKIPSNIWLMPSMILILLVPEIINNTHGEYAQDKLFRLLTVGMVAVLSSPVLINTKWSLKYASVIMLVLSVIMGIFMSLEIYQGIEYWRWQMFGISTISLGRGFGYGLVVAFFLALRSRSWSLKTLFGIMAICMAIFIIGIGNRQGLVGGVVAIFVGGMVMSAGSARKAGYSFIILIGLSATMLYALPNLVPEDALSRVFAPFEGGLGGDASSQSRLYIFSEAIRLFEQHPTGAGVGAFSNLGLRSNQVDINYPHNIFLEILSEGGLQALFIFLLINLYAAYKMLIMIIVDRDLVLMSMIAIVSFVAANLSSDLPGNKLYLAIMAVAVCWGSVGTKTIEAHS